MELFAKSMGSIQLNGNGRAHPLIEPPIRNRLFYLVESELHQVVKPLRSALFFFGIVDVCGEYKKGAATDLQALHGFHGNGIMQAIGGESAGGYRDVHSHRKAVKRRVGHNQIERPAIKALDLSDEVAMLNVRSHVAQGAGGSHKAAMIYFEGSYFCALSCKRGHECSVSDSRLKDRFARHVPEHL